MTKEEARERIDLIHRKIGDMREYIFELYEQEGWKALGYSTWGACVETEFKQERTYIHYQCKAAQIEHNISLDVHRGEQIPERHLRPLSKIKDPEQQREVWEKVVETAPNGKVTGDYVEKIVEETINPMLSAQIIPSVEEKIQVDSQPLSNLKTMWTACRATDKRKFIKWLREYFPEYLKFKGGLQ